MNNRQCILVVSFGTSYDSSRELTIGGIERHIAQTFPDYEVRRAFTSQVILELLRQRDGIEIDNVREALSRARRDGITRVIIQPTHMMAGFEFMDLKREALECSSWFDSLRLAAPLLTDDEDYTALIRIITNKLSCYDDGQTAICLMGHGTDAQSNEVYTILQRRLRLAGFSNYFIGTIEAKPDLDDELTDVKSRGCYSRVVLEPLMVVAGDHANNDMAGDGPDTWRAAFEREGYEVVCILEGLGQLPEFQEIYAAHIRAVMS